MNVIYELLHQHVIEIEAGEEISDTKLLGFFESEEKCREAINYYIEQAGFETYPDGFVVNKIEADVDDYNSIPGRFDKKVYYLSHEWYDGEYDYVTDIGYYSTLQKAESAKVLIQFDEEFIEQQDGFVIDEYSIGEMEWKEGFCSWDDLECIEEI